MRITQRAVALTSLQGLNRNLEQIGKLQEQLTSGRMLNRPSDSPTGTNRAMQIRDERAALAQQSRNISDARGWLDRTDDTLQTMLDATQRVRDLTVQGMNEGALSDQARTALSVEISALREGLRTSANTQYQGRLIFGGISAGTEAYDAAGAYVGVAGPAVTRRISDVESMPVDIPGTVAFGSAPTDLFTVVQAIADDVVANPAALDGHLTALDTVMRAMQSAVAEIGARGARLERAEQVNGDRLLSLASSLAEAEDIDLPATIMQLQMRQVGYESALAATAKALQPTLLDFLR